MPATVRQYELVYIIAPDRNDDQIQAIIAKYKNLITAQGGEVERTDIWERRRLAYEIKGYNEGVYIVSLFRGLPQVEAELRRVFGISEDTIRSIIVRPDVEVDPTIPTVAPREFGGGREYGGGGRDYDNRRDYRGPSTTAVASSAVIAEVQAEATTEVAEGDETSIAAAASDPGVPEAAASDEGTEIGTAEPVAVG